MFALLLAQRTALGPCAVAVDIMLLLPDWRLVLDDLNGQPAGAEGLVAVRGGGHHQHGGVVNAQTPPGVGNIKLERIADLVSGAFGNGPKGVERQRLENIVADAGNLSTKFVF